MPFKSESQRRLFYAKMKRGEFSPEMVERWEKHTPKGKLPEKLASAAALMQKLRQHGLKFHMPAGQSLHERHLRKTLKFDKKASMDSFWNGFTKRAAENFQTTGSPVGSPEKLLKWNDQGGVDPRTPEDMQKAQASALKTLPTDVPGAMCGTCVHFRSLSPELGHGFCTNPEIQMDVTEHMHCAHWEHPGAYDPVQAAAEEAQAQQFQQAQMAQAGGQVPPEQAGQASPEQAGAAPGQEQMPMQDQLALQGQAGAGASAQPEGSVEGGQPFKPSPVANQSGFPQGQQTSQNPLVEQAVNDFQGEGATAGPTGQGGGEEAAPKKPKKKKSEKSEQKDSKGNTINIHVGKGAEKTASLNYWAGIVDGY